MKKAILFVISCLYTLSLSAQQELHIHHINIENGDATMIGIYDVAHQAYTSKILIDGGQSKPADMLLPYIDKMVGEDADAHHFNYIILTHYHNDHYNGLLAIKTGAITADSIIDPGGYPINTVFDQTASIGTTPPDLTIAGTWLSALTTAAHHSPVPFVKGHSRILLRYGTDTKTNLGNKVTIGKIGTNKVQLQAIAGWGNTWSTDGEIVPDPAPTKNNPNNYTLAFILTCGQFRYFIGGDMGGSNSGKYINQETAVTALLQNEFPTASSIDKSVHASGHICGFKANHHGSNNSNTTSFMEGMHPAIIVTSAGDNASWHLPHPDYLARVKLVTPLSAADPANGPFARGIYFTNLYDFSDEYSSLTTAKTLFKNKQDISYNYGNNTATAKASYLIKVTDAVSINKQSSFEVGRVDIDKPHPYKTLANFTCHVK